MADTDAGVQESNATDEFAGINPDDVAALISGSVTEIPSPEQSDAEQSNTGVPQQPSDPTPPAISMNPAEIQDMIQKGIAAGIQNGNANNANNGGQSPDDFFGSYEDGLKKSFATKHGLNEEGAAFMAATTMEGIRPLVQMMAKGFQNLSNRDAQITQDGLVDQVDRNINSWLDDKGIKDPVLRDDVAKLTRYNSAGIENADMNTLRAEFEKVAGRFIRQQVTDEEEIIGQAETDQQQIPPIVNSGKLGFDDIVGKVVKSTAKEDDIGGERLVGLAERMIKQGMQGGGV